MIMEEPMNPLARILCVDDGPANLSLLEGLLSPLGYDVVMAANGQQALEKIKTEPIDLCLLDIIMPGMDGLEVCRRIKSDPATRNIPVVLLTALTESQHRILGAEAGAEDFISKPFNTTEVLARIKMLLHVKSINDRLQTAYQEITDLKNSLEERVARAIDEIRQKDQMLIAQGRMAAMGEMIHNIAHQWRQPLNVLGLHIQLLHFYHENSELTGELLEENTRKSMEVIQYMSQTIDDFRNFFQSDKEMVEFTISDVVARTVSLVEDSLRSLQISIDVFTNTKATIVGFPAEYSQVLLNIIMNSKDSLLARHHENARVTITISKEEERSVVTIADNGGGIPEDIIDKIFEPYFSTKGPEQGTGLGLFMSKTIIEKNMSGHLTVRNSGDGAEFRIEV
jgi:C4-dicarboxylate-specific signal transduction histidine kinase